MLILETLNRHLELPVASAVELWRERDAAWKRDAPLGIVAGTAPLGLGRAPLGHSLLIVSAKVGRQVECFMREGRFE